MAQATERKRLRQHDLNLQRIRRHIAYPQYPVQLKEMFKIFEDIKFIPKFDDVKMTSYLLEFRKALLLQDLS